MAAKKGEREKLGGQGNTLRLPSKFHVLQVPANLQEGDRRSKTLQRLNFKSSHLDNLAAR